MSAILLKFQKSKLYNLDTVVNAMTRIVVYRCVAHGSKPIRSQDTYQKWDKDIYPMYMQSIVTLDGQICTV